MKPTCTLKNLLLIACLFAVATATGQTQTHPLAYAITTGTVTVTNFYKDYVGTRFSVNSPAVVAGEKAFTQAVIGPSDWPDINPVASGFPFINQPVVMPPLSDSTACSALAPGSMTGKIALVWRGPIASPCSFTQKAFNAQQAGAKACVIINEYPGEGPIVPGYTSGVGIVTIPVYMIGNLDGTAIVAEYKAGAAVNMTITTWGQNLRNDLGFVPGGVATWHNFAIPVAQLAGGGASTYGYRAIDGAFIANFGTSKANNVMLSAHTTFTPAGGSPTTIHTSTVSLTPSFDNTDPTADSIWALFSAPYALTGVTGNGEIRTTYSISSDTASQFPADSTTSISFFTTDSTYSKGRYNFMINEPIRGIYERFGSGEFLWGPMYYIANGGSFIKNIQYSLSGNNTGPTLPGTSNTVFIFKWLDGSGTIAPTKDSVVQNDELSLIGSGTKFFSENPSDTSGGLMTLSAFTDASGNPANLSLDADSWYYIAVDVPSSSGTPLFLGADGILNPLPRIYGLFQDNGVLDYNNILGIGSESTVITTPGAFTPCPTTGVSFVTSVDSFVFSYSKGLIPAVVMNSTTHPLPPEQVNGGPVKTFTNVTVYPNPATDVLKVSVNLEQTAKTVSYVILDGRGRFVSRTTHNDVRSEQYNISTSNLAAGNYFLAITADGRTMAKTFTVTK